MVPIFTFVVYPVMGKFFKVTPLRKIGIGLFVTGGSFLIVAWIESRIQSGHSVSAWWQIVAYLVMTAGEVLVSITALEFSYKQAPLRMKSFIMSLFLLSTSIGNLMTAGVNSAMVKPVHASAIETGADDLGEGRRCGQLRVGPEDRLRRRHGHQGRRCATARARRSTARTWFRRSTAPVGGCS